jgi:hypothetical protein
VNVDQVTDPSREIAALIDWLRSRDAAFQGAGNQPNCWQVLSRALDLDVNSSEFLEIFSAVRSRIGNLNIFLSNLSDPSVGNDVTQAVRDALARLAGAFNPANLNNPWSQAMSQWVIAADATTFRMFSPIMSQYQPLKRLSDAERGEALKQIQGALSDLEAAEDIGPWERIALSHGYRRLELCLKYFEFTGHVGLAREYLLAKTATQAAERGLKANSKTLESAWRALVLTAKIVEIVAAPSVFYHAVADYSRLFMLDNSRPESVLLLPAPSQDPPGSRGSEGSQCNDEQSA